MMNSYRINKLRLALAQYVYGILAVLLVNPLSITYAQNSKVEFSSYTDEDGLKLVSTNLAVTAESCGFEFST